MDQQQVEFTQTTLVNAVDRYNERIRRGQQMRHLIHEAIENGMTPSHYRVDWLKDSVIRVFQELEAIALDFNTEHTDDCCSSTDLADVLTSALATMREEYGDD